MLLRKMLLLSLLFQAYLFFFNCVFFGVLGKPLDPQNTSLSISVENTSLVKNTVTTRYAKLEDLSIRTEENFKPGIVLNIECREGYYILNGECRKEYL